ncbi:MAG: TetR family transcriptional regulator C-terminal domain-containing protein [Candidatus Binatia bacterium]
MHDLQPYFLIFFGEERELPPRTRRRFRSWAREMTDEVAAILVHGREAGTLRHDVDPRIAAFLLIGMLTSIARWYDPRGRLSKEEIATQVARVLGGYIREGMAPARATRKSQHRPST